VFQSRSVAGPPLALTALQPRDSGSSGPGKEKKKSENPGGEQEEKINSPEKPVIRSVKSWAQP